MNAQRLIGAGLFIAGGALLFKGMSASIYTSASFWYLLVGMALAVPGMLLAILGKRSKLG